MELGVSFEDIQDGVVEPEWQVSEGPIHTDLYYPFG